MYIKLDSLQRGSNVNKDEGKRKNKDAICVVYWTAGGSWLLSSKQSSKPRLNRGEELIVDSGAWSTERKRRNQSVTTPSCGMFLSVSRMMGGGMLPSKPYFFSLPIITDTPIGAHTSLSQRISPPFGHEQCYYSFCYRQYLCAGAVQWNSLESSKVLILVFKPLC